VGPQGLWNWSEPPGAKAWQEQRRGMADAWPLDVQVVTISDELLDAVDISFLNETHRQSKELDPMKVTRFSSTSGPRLCTCDSCERSAVQKAAKAKAFERPPERKVGDDERRPGADLEGMDSSWVDEGRVLCVMIRNIAWRFSDDDVVAILEEGGLKDKFDAVYVPKNPAKRLNLGYAFVHFKEPEFAAQCFRVWHGTRFGQSYGKKLCAVQPARLQGIEYFEQQAAKSGCAKKPGTATPVFLGSRAARLAGPEAKLRPPCDGEAARFALRPSVGTWLLAAPQAGAKASKPYPPTAAD